MDFAEFDYNLAEGEFSTASENKSVTLIYGEQSYEVSAIVSKKYARKEVDGRFTTDLPTFTLSVVIAESQIPQSITEDDYRLLNVKVGEQTYAVRFVTGTGMLTLTLKPLDEEEETVDSGEVIGSEPATETEPADDEIV